MRSGQLSSVYICDLIEFDSIRFDSPNLYLCMALSMVEEGLFSVRLRRRMGVFSSSSSSSSCAVGIMDGSGVEARYVGDGDEGF